MYQSSAPLSAVSQQDLRGILNERDSDARQQALHAAGAKNAVPLRTSAARKMVSFFPGTPCLPNSATSWNVVTAQATPTLRHGVPL